MKICVDSELGRLKGVVIHAPGSEVENMTPENAERALYSDILNLAIASREFAQLEGVLKKVTQVFQVKDLLTGILSDESVKRELTENICRTEGALFLRDELVSCQPDVLAGRFIEGIVLKRNNLTSYLSNERFSIRPLHNLFFTRDAAMGMNDCMLIGKMANPVRERETLIMEAIFNHYPGFDATIINPSFPREGITADDKYMLEGGDFQVIREDVFIIGTGVRTSTQGIDFIIENIKQTKTEPHHIIVQELPSTPESFIHLDMVFTLLDTDSCMVYEPVIYKMNRLRTLHIRIENREVTEIREVPDIPFALKELGMDFKPILCGGKNDSWIQEREQWHSGANFVAFEPGKIIGYARNAHTMEELNKNGFEILNAVEVINGKVSPDNYKKCVVQIAGSELARAGGGARCMTLPVCRDKVVW